MKDLLNKILNIQLPEEKINKCRYSKVTVYLGIYLAE